MGGNKNVSDAIANTVPTQHTLDKNIEDTIQFNVFDDVELTNNMLPHKKVDLMNRAIAEVRKKVARRKKKRVRNVKDSELDDDAILKEVNKLRKKPIHGAARKGTFTDLAVDCNNKHKNSD